MPRNIGTIPLAAIQANRISTAWFVCIEIPADTFVYYTDRASDYYDANNLIRGDDSAHPNDPVNWTAYDIRVGSIVQNQTSPLDVSYVDFENLDNVWSAYLLSTGTRFRNVWIYYGWFDPDTDEFLGSMKLFDGRTDEATIGSRIHIALVPHRTPWNAILPARRFGPGCGFLYRNGDTCQYQQIQPPGNVQLSQIGGSLPPATYYYQLTAVGMGGETNGSTEQSITLSTTAGVNITWDEVPFAGGYRIYGRSSGAGKLRLTPDLLPLTPRAYNDTTLGSPAVALPASNGTGLLPSCARTLLDCQLHQNAMHFGGFVKLPKANFKFAWGSINPEIPPASQYPYESLQLDPRADVITAGDNFLRNRPGGRDLRPR